MGGTGDPNHSGRAFAMPGQETRLRARQVRVPLLRQRPAVHAHVAHEHFQPLLERRADDLAVAHVLAFGEGHAVGHGPRVALARDGAKLIGHSQPLLVRSDDGGEQLAGKFPPEVIEEILQRAAHAPVIIRRAQQQHVGAFDPRPERGEIFGGVRGIGIEQRQRFGQQIEQIDLAAGLREPAGSVLEHTARDGTLAQAADDHEDIQCGWCHAGEVSDSFCGRNPARGQISF